jgi:hypothetical protein
MLIKNLLLGGSVLSLLILAGCGGTSGADYAEFAQCLNDEEIVMYGAFWCPHCEDQKDLFGDSFENINYVECDANGENPQPELCIANQITGYPTWTRSDGEQMAGFRTLEQLEAFSTCELPEGAPRESVEPAVEVVEPVAEPTPAPVEELAGEEEVEETAEPISAE